MSETLDLNIADIASDGLTLSQTMARWNEHLAMTDWTSGHTVATLMRDYPTITPDMAAAIGASGMQADDPMIHQIIELDNRAQADGLWDFFQGATRFGVGTLIDFYDNTFPRAMREITRMYQGESPMEAFRNSGSTLAGRVATETRLNGPPTFDRVYGASGFMPGDNPDPAMQPGASAVLKGYMSQGYDPATAVSYTRAYQVQNDAGSLFDKNRQLAESTMLHNTLADGRTVAYHATPGNMFWYPSIKTWDPESFGFQLVTGATDGFASVALDPLNPGFDWMTDIARSHKTAVRAADLTANETADAMARAYGGRSLEQGSAGARQDFDIAFHGTEVRELEGGQLTRGGISSRLSEARGFAGDEGMVHVFDPEDLPEHMKNVYFDGESTYNSIEQIIPRETAQNLFPHFDPDDLYLEAGRVARAKKFIEDDELFSVFAARGQAEANMAGYMDEALNQYQRISGKYTDTAHQFIGTYDPKYLDDLPEVGKRLKVEGELFEHPLEVRAAVAEWDNPERLLEAIDQYMEAHTILDESWLLADDLSPEQVELIQRIGILENGRDFVWGDVDEALTPLASYSAAELREMDSLGYVFKTREGFENYKAWRAELTEAGVYESRGKWFVHPQKWETWSASKKGQRIFKFTAEHTITDIKKKFPQMPQDMLWQLHFARRPSQTEAIIKQWFGSPASGGKVPVRTAPANALSAVKDWVGNSPGKIQRSVYPAFDRLSNYGRRLAAEVGHSRIDPYDFDVTWDYVDNAGRTLGKTDAEIEHTMGWLDPRQVRLDEKGKPIKDMRERGRRLQEEVFDWLEKDLAASHGEEYAKYVIEQWREAELKNRMFAENAAGRPLELKSPIGRRLENGNKEVLDLIDGGEPLLDSQLAQRYLFMPTIRELRRVTSGIRKVTESARMGRSMTDSVGDLTKAVGIGTSRFQKGVDGYLAVWRNLALLRIGWMMRVLPDEIGRMYFAGYSDIMTNPLAYVLYSAGKRGDQLDELTSLRQMTDTFGLGADNGLFRGIDNQPFHDVSARGSNWSRVRASDNNFQLNAPGANGVARRILQLYQSRLADVIYDHATIDDAVRFLRDNVDENNILREIWGSARDGDQLHRTAVWGKEGERQLRRVLEVIDAQRHQYTGGYWVGKNSTGGWVDQAGKPIEVYDLPLKDLQDLAKQRNLPHYGTKRDIRARLLSQDGMPKDLPWRKEAAVVVRQGRPELLDLIRHGRQQGTPSPRRAQTYAAREIWRNKYGAKAKTADYVFMVVPEGKSWKFAVADGDAQIWTSFDRAAGRVKGMDQLVAVEVESLPPSLLSRKLNKNGSITPTVEDIKHAKSHEFGPISGDEILTEGRKALEQGEVKMLGDEMTKDDLRELEEYLTTAYSADYPPVSHVHVPDKAYGEFDVQRGIVDALYDIIGKNPTLMGVRRPYATLRTWEVMAGHYIGAAPDVRKAIMANAQKAGIEDRFVSFVDDALRRNNLNAPTVRHNATVEEIVELSWGEAIRDTKDLFYDLTKGDNWADASRFVFPFADAWWEVLSRWGKLANPKHSGGAPLKAARRVGSMWNAMEGQGYFTENEEGERVFEIPGTAQLFNMFNAASPVQLQGQVSLEQLTFVDFGAPSQALKPGFTPHVQLGAGFVRNVLFETGYLPESFRDNYDKFFFGNFAPPAGQLTNFQENLELFLPTWMRRTINRIWEGDFDENYASMVVRLANGWAASIGPEATTNPDIAKAIVQEAERQAAQIATIDIFSSLVTPAQPRKVAQMLLVDEEGTEYLKSITALATDFRYMKDIYGPQQAVEIFQKAYGFDPLSLAPTYWSDERAPVTNDAWEYLIDRPQISEHTRYTMMAWIPQELKGEFNIDAWRAADYERLTGEDAAAYWSYAAGAHRLAGLRNTRDEILEDLEKRYGGTDNPGYRHMVDTVVMPWYNLEMDNIDTQYYAYVPGEGLAGVTNRPSYRQIWRELEHIGTPGSKANADLREVDPVLVNFVEYATGLWNEMDSLALEMGYGSKWWQTSESEANGAPTIRKVYADALNQYAGSMPPQQQGAARYIGQYYLAPLLAGFDWDNPVIIAPSTPSNAELGYADQLGARSNG